MATKSAFISYSWDDKTHKDWVRDFATRLRADGIDARLDQWELVPGDQIPHFMERSVRDADYVLIVCTPGYKRRSEARRGGVGYEGDIITSEIMTSGNQRKFIPVLRTGTWTEAAPSWLVGKYGVDLCGESLPREQYEDLIATITGGRAGSPPVGGRNRPWSPSVTSAQRPTELSKVEVQAPIRILGVIVDEVSAPRGDGSRGSALYRIPFKLSASPSSDWARAFVATWARPPRWTSMHRPGIADVLGDKIILDGTTIEEVKEVHRETLLLCVDEANRLTLEAQRARREQEERKRKLDDDHRRNVADQAGDIDF